MLTRIYMASLVAVVIAAAGCSSQDTDVAVPPATSVAAEREFTFISEQLERDIQNLQLAVDRQLEEMIASCMANQGFEYTPMTIEELNFVNGGTEEVLYGNVAQMALDSVFIPNSDPNVSPSNQGNVSELSDEEISQWQSTRQDCQVSESARQVSPWETIHTDWYSSLEKSASDRTLNDARYVDAFDEATRCMEDGGYGSDIAALKESAVASTSEVVDRFFSGELDENEARQQLESISTEQSSIAEVVRRCQGPRIAIERAVYLEYLNASVESNDVALAEWLVDVEDELSAFRRQLDEVDFDS